FSQRIRYLIQEMGETAAFRLFPSECGEILRRIFLRSEHGPKNRSQESPGADIECELYVWRDHVCSAGLAGDTKSVLQHPRQQARNHSAQADKETLHGKTGSSLLFRQVVGHESTKWFH